MLWMEGYGNTRFATMERDEDFVKAVFEASIESEEMFCKVVEVNDEVVGILLGMVDLNMWGVLTAQTLISYSRHETDKLLRQFIAWSKDQGAKQVTISTVPGNEKYERIVKGLKLTESGKLYTKEI